MKVGDKVICIKSHSEGATVKGKIYTVLGIIKCKGCGSASLDVGVEIYEGSLATFCSYCNTTINSSKTWYQGIKRFRKIEPHTFKNKVTKELALKPLTEEKIEVVPRELEIY